MITVKRKVNFQRGPRTRKKRGKGKAKSLTGVGRVPRASRLMALAIRFDQLIRDGIVADQAELARLGHVSRARVTQIMNLLNLAPEIQESILCRLEYKTGQRGITERHLRSISVHPDWKTQRRLWKRLESNSQI